MESARTTGPLPATNLAELRNKPIKAVWQGYASNLSSLNAACGAGTQRRSAGHFDRMALTREGVLCAGVYGRRSKQ